MESIIKEVPESDVFLDKIKREFSPSPESQTKIIQTLALMQEVHADQHPRADGAPYFTHPLDVASQVLNCMTHKDADLVIAALLHDSLEDQANKLAQKSNLQTGTQTDRALEFLSSTFGHRITQIITELSNPDFDSLLHQQGLDRGHPDYTRASNRIYADHVQEAIEDPDVALIKFFDFSANALHLDNVTDPKRKAKLTTKYSPVIQIFIDRLLDTSKPLNISDAKKEEFLAALRAAS